MKARRVFYFGKFFVIGLAGLALFTYVVLLLWNWLVPELFNGPELNYWQTLGIMVLSKILFTGVIGHGRRPMDYRNSCEDWDHHGHFHPRDYWKKRFKEKMNGKFEEEKKDGE